MSEEAAMTTITVGRIRSEAWLQTRVDGVLTDEQARTAREVIRYLEEQQERLANGRYVQRPIDLLRWFLESVETAQAHGGTGLVKPGGRCAPPGPAVQ